MSDSTKSSAYFYRIITLVVDVGTETLRDTFYSKVPKADVSTFFSTSPIKAEFSRLKENHILTSVQYEHVLVNPDPDKYDIALLLKLLTNRKISEISPPTNGWGAIPDPADLSLGADLIRIRNVRNELVGHRHSTQLEESEFNDSWSKVETILERIASSVSPDEEANIKQKIKDAKTRVLEPLDDREEKLLQVFLQWRKEEDEKTQAQLTDIEKSLASMHLKVDGIPRSSTSTDDTDAARSDNTCTLSSIQSQLVILAKHFGVVQEMNQKVQNMPDEMKNICQTVAMIKKQQDENHEENKRFMEEMTKQRRTSGNKGISVTPVYPRVCNPNAMTEKQISELSRQIGSEWEQLRIHLEYTEAQGYALKTTYNNNVQQMIHVMLKSWHDVVADCGENPKMLLAAAFVNASNNYSLAYKLVPQDSFDATASVNKSIVDQIKQITFSKSEQDGDKVDGNYGVRTMNVHGGGTVTIQNISNCSFQLDSLQALPAGPIGHSYSSTPAIRAEHNLKTTGWNAIQLHTMVQHNERKCSVQEP